MKEEILNMYLLLRFVMIIKKMVAPEKLMYWKLINQTTIYTSSSELVLEDSRF